MTTRFTVHTRLTDAEAQHFAAQLRSLNFRVAIVPIFAGSAFLEVRQLPGERGQKPAITLRTAEDCRAFLRSIPT